VLARAPRRGEIWYAFTPGQPDDPHQPRPALVVSTDARNANSDDAIVVPLFSRGAPGPTRIPLPAGMSGLRHDSVLFCEEVTTLDHVFFERGPLGTRVGPELLDRVVRAIRRAVGDVVPEP
jgi:mRNA-degrading endonuclease toxin of MazEF toxin-antitoxin module